jgi:hypothetical protein
MLGVGGGLVRIENNLFVENLEGVNAIRFIAPVDPSSTFRFNTLVQTSPVTTSAAGIACVDGLVLSSNILAYNSTSPLSGPCVTRHSLFDLPGAPAAMAGQNNRSADVATFFVNRAANDFRLAAGSPAIELGQPGLVTIDVDGSPRPSPAGTNPDSGAHEAP